jgi:predicted ATPase/DNA-binding XRE family transcriptional regulator
MDTESRFGTLLRQYRTLAGLSQEDLAERAGLSRRGISDLERGARRVPHLGTVRRLSEALALDQPQQAALIESARAVTSTAPQDEPRQTPPANRTNLPHQWGTLIGRQRELAEVAALLQRQDVGLVTLTGAGGSGKTRLAIGVARELVDDFQDGVFLVLLAPLTDASAVVPTIAQELGIRDFGDRPLLEVLTDVLRQKHILLVIDNFEHVRVAAVAVGDLLRACDRLKVLVTSRAPLALSDEHEFPVPPLALPDREHLPPVEALAQYASIRLFSERAAALSRDFILTEQSTPVIAEICDRLDGLPLAIELAAARIRVLSPEVMLGRLDRRLPLLTGGAVDLPSRQRTLRATIAWSYDLLSPAEQLVFRRLAICPGDFGLDTAQQICGDAFSPTDLLEGLTSLMAQNLLTRRADLFGEPRFGMLQTIREFGLEQLERTDELGRTRLALATSLQRLAGETGPFLRTHRQVVSLGRLLRDQDNFRAVLGWSRDGLIEPDIGLRLVSRMWWFWHHRTDLTQGRFCVESALEAARTGEAADAAEARIAAGVLAFNQGDNAAARVYYERALQLGRRLGDDRVIGYAHLFESILTTNVEGELEQATGLMAVAEELFSGVGETWGIAMVRCRQSVLARLRGDYTAARVVGQQGLELFRQVGDRFGIGHALLSLGQADLAAGEPRRAMAQFRAMITAMQDIGNTWFVARGLFCLATSACMCAQYDLSATLLGCADKLRESFGAPVYLQDVHDHARVHAELVDRLGDAQFQSAYAAGRSTIPEEMTRILSLDEAVLRGSRATYSRRDRQRPNWTSAATIRESIQL